MLIVESIVAKFVYFSFLFQLDPINVINRLSKMGFFNILLGRSSRLNIRGVLTKKSNGRMELGCFGLKFCVFGKFNWKRHLLWR
ncbi:hypothetical protein [Vibrio hibernica]|uniref:hypothetical protein n=1 Tax=Vibrio hibernica TaxID=2587465 RepID=UPI001E56FFE8|nr:hypothetical protein [Vibrio hibernica]